MSLCCSLLIAAAGDNRAAATVAARELSRQLFALQNTIATIPGPPEGRALYKECEQVQNLLTTFRRLMKNHVGGAQLVANFDKVNAKVERLLGDIKGFTEWDAALRGASGEVRAAVHDLQFAIASGDGSPMSAAKAAYRQTMALVERGEQFTSMVRYVFDEQDALKAWNADLAAFHKAATDLKRLQADHAPTGDLRRQFVTSERTWAKVVGRINALPESQFLLLKRRAAQVDQVLGRLADIYGVRLGRPPLADPLGLEDAGARDSRR